MNSQRFGRFEIRQRLGDGPAATVVRAFDTQTQQEVVLKILRPEFCADPAARQRFTPEMQPVARLNGLPGILPLLQTGEEMGRIFLAYAFVPGETLDRAIRSRGPMPWPNVLAMTAQIAQALEGAHNQGFLHLDLKPQNILCANNGGFSLLDTGFTRALAAARLPGSTWPNPASAAYLAPEVWQGTPPIGPAADQYALACVLYEALTGRVLFEGAPAEVMQRHLAAPPVLAPLPADVPPSTATALFRALAKNPAERYPNLRGLYTALANAPVTGTPSQVFQPQSGQAQPSATAQPQAAGPLLTASQPVSRPAYLESYQAGSTSPTATPRPAPTVLSGAAQTGAAYPPAAQPAPIPQPAARPAKVHPTETRPRERKLLVPALIGAVVLLVLCVAGMAAYIWFKGIPGGALPTEVAGRGTAADPSAQPSPQPVTPEPHTAVPPTDPAPTEYLITPVPTTPVPLTLTPPTAVPPFEVPEFFENFDQGFRAEWLGGVQTWQTINGRAMNTEDGVIYLGDSRWDNYEVSYEFYLPDYLDSGRIYGFYYGIPMGNKTSLVPPPESLLVNLWYYPSSESFAIAAPENPFPPITVTDKVQRHQVNIWKAQIRGPMIKFWLNDQLVAEIGAPKSIAGGSGVTVYDDVQIDNYRVVPVR